MYEKIEEKLRGIGANTKGLKKKIADWAKGVALQGNANKEKGYIGYRFIHFIEKKSNAETFSNRHQPVERALIFLSKLKSI